MSNVSRDEMLALAERAFVEGFIAHMKNPEADPFNEWETSEIHAALRARATKESKDATG
jgi:hypothetical protein